jgi:hypothetical protein
MLRAIAKRRPKRLQPRRYITDGQHVVQRRATGQRPVERDLRRVGGEAAVGPTTANAMVKKAVQVPPSFCII